MAVAIHPPESGPCEGLLGRGLPLEFAAVVNVSVVVTAEAPGVTDGGANDAVVFGGRFEAENVTAFGKVVPVAGEIWIVAVIG